GTICHRGGRVEAPCAAPWHRGGTDNGICTRPMHARHAGRATIAFPHHGATRWRAFETLPDPGPPDGTMTPGATRSRAGADATRATMPTISPANCRIAMAMARGVTTARPIPRVATARPAA